MVVVKAKVIDTGKTKEKEITKTFRYKDNKAFEYNYCDDFDDWVAKLERKGLRVWMEGEEEVEET